MSAINPKTTIREIEVAGAPAVPGLRFRGFGGDGDLPRMVQVFNRVAAADRIERVTTLDEIRNFYTHQPNFDPSQDLLLAEVDDELVGYGRVAIREEAGGLRLGLHWASLVPDWRRRGIGGAMLAAAQRRLREIAADLPPGPRTLFQSNLAEGEVGAHALLQREGYTPTRRSFVMARPDLDHLPKSPLPAGLVVRTARREEYRKVFEADTEAFQDHWGYIPPAEEDFERWLGEPTTDPGLWQVAWDGDEVAGMVLNYINAEENTRYNRSRGYTEDICVRRPWRRRGLARALIVRSLAMLRDRGMSQAALGVDAENLTGALGLYESLGYRPVQRWTLYRKEMQLHRSDR